AATAGEAAGQDQDEVRATQWQVDAVRAREAWHLADGRGVVVAVVDSGVDAQHPDLAGQVLPGVDLVDGNESGYRDPVGHGTTNAALIVGRADDDIGVIGVAPAARVLPVRVLDERNVFTDPGVV